MKKKKLIITTSILSLSLVAILIPANIAIIKAINGGNSRTLSSEIVPTKPGRGETVSFLPESLTQFWNMDNLIENYPSKAQEIGELTPYTDELAGWINYLSNTETDVNKRRELFEKYDIFRPTNNVLSWNSSIPAKSYRVIISQDKSFTTIERDYTVAGTEDSVTFDNPYTGTDYYWQVIATKNDDSLVYSDIFNFSTASLPRTLSIEGVSNTRDLGGNIGLNGKRMKEGLIYRGMGLEAITDNGANEFKNGLGIKSELDLRGINEGIENFLNLPNYYHYSSPYVWGNGASDPTAIDYFGEGSLVANFGNAIKVLANKDNYPVYFHCFVGRDRTGWLGICVNLLCGVSEEITLKDFCLSLFSTSGAYTKGSTDFYIRFTQMVNYIKTFSGDNLSEQTENYLVSKAGVTHEQCENIRKILLGDIDTGFVPGQDNPDSYENLCKVTFRRYGESPIIKLVESGSLLEEPVISGNGNWYNGNTIWNFATDVVTEDLYLDFIATNKCKVSVRYSGIDIPDDAIDVAFHNTLDFTMFNRDGYTFKVYDDSFNRITSLLVESDLTINVVYSRINGYVPKGNSRIILMAGQSNGAGVAHYPYLGQSVDEAKVEEINNGYKNVLITGCTNGEMYEGYKPVRADKLTRTVGVAGTFGFEVGLADRLSKAFPDETTYIFKYAYGSASLNYDWISPSSKDVEELIGPIFVGKERGWLYNDMVSCLEEKIAEIEQLTNTIPMVEAFMWMQGESDATSEALNNVYLSTFNNMISDFTKKFSDNISYKFAVYDAGIAVVHHWPCAEQMNAAKKSREDSRNVYIDTNGRGLTTLFEPVGEADTAHYDAACYIDLGHMFADAYLLHNDKNYKHNEVTISGPDKVTISLSGGPVTVTPTAYFNGVYCDAKFSFFSKDVKLFKVNSDNTLTGVLAGTSQLRITAYYQDEVKTIIIPVEITR